MEIEKLIDKFEEIKSLAENLSEQENPDDNRMLEEIYSICENVIIDYKVEKRLNDS